MISEKSFGLLWKVMGIVHNFIDYTINGDNNQQINPCLRNKAFVAAPFSL